MTMSDKSVNVETMEVEETDDNGKNESKFETIPSEKTDEKTEDSTDTTFKAPSAPFKAPSAPFKPPAAPIRPKSVKSPAGPLRPPSDALKQPAPLKPLVPEEISQSEASQDDTGKAAEADALLQYKEPKWSGTAAYPYTLEVLKNGKIIEEVDITESRFVTVGRLPSCDVPCLHPSISRYHAVFQHRTTEGETPGGVFLYDLGSSHGTTVNKVKISPRTYYMLKTGYVIKFGLSTRLHIVKGPAEEAFEDEQDMIPEPLPEKGQSAEEKLKKFGILAAEEADIMLRMLKSRQSDNQEPEDEKQKTVEGVGWGFREDAKEDEDGELKLDVGMMARPAEFKDPKKTLRGYFEREGVELEYTVTEKGTGKSHQYVCKVAIPLDTPNPVYAEGVSNGKKKDAVLACALHGCQLLDAYGALRNSTRFEDIETKTEKLAKNDFYDSDEDTFLDRTGEVENKRKRRMLRAGVNSSSGTSKTHDMLSKELLEVDTEIFRIQGVIADSKSSKDEAEEGVDELDAYMNTVSNNTVDTGALKELKKKLNDLKHSRVKLERLCEMSKPVLLPQVKRAAVVPSHIMTGKVGKFSAPSIPSVTSTKTSGIVTPNILPNKRIKIQLGKPIKKKEITPETNNERSPEKITTISEFITEDPESDQTLLNPQTPEEPDITSESQETSPKSESVPKAKRKRPSKKPTHTATISDSVMWDDTPDDSFVNWTPPTCQKGDGKTKLNQKYGY